MGSPNYYSNTARSLRERVRWSVKLYLHLRRVKERLSADVTFSTLSNL